VPKLSRKSELAKAFRYMPSGWKALLRYLDDGRLLSTTILQSGPSAV
jgi:hypothetical protein